jgi:hypothetical protein
MAVVVVAELTPETIFPKKIPIAAQKKVQHKPFLTGATIPHRLPGRRTANKTFRRLKWQIHKNCIDFF